MSADIKPLPLFPLSTIVLPGGLLPLRLFEPRYIKMVSNCFKQESGFGVCLIREGQEAGAPAEPYPQGTLVEIINFDQGSDGLLQITTQGKQEFVVHGYEIQDDGLVVGQVELQARPDESALNQEHNDLAIKLELILDHLEPHMHFTDRKLDDAEWVSNRLLELLPLDPGSKFKMLRSMDLGDRLQALSSLEFSVSDE